MRDAWNKLVEQYTASLEGYLAKAGEASLHSAYELGRKAMADGWGVLEMARVHAEALTSLLRRIPQGQETLATVGAAGKFFAEVLSPFEMTHRTFLEANMALRRVNELLEEEAKRIAHALHDEAGQLLASAHIALDGLQREVPPREGTRLQELKGLLKQIEEQLRHLSHELRPLILDDFGLVAALEFLAQGVADRTGMSVAVKSSADGRFPAPVETALYRIVQEALTNVGKHARANRVRIQVERESDGIRCLVKDDGIGFDAKTPPTKGQQGLGLVGIRERVSSLGGTLAVNSRPAQGTELCVTIPLERSETQK